MKLYRKGRDVPVIDALAGPVVEIFKADVGSVRQGVGAHRVAVVLAGDVYSSGRSVPDRLIGAAVAVAQLFGFAAAR